MHQVGIDLHKKSIVLCVLDDQLNVVARRTFACVAVADIRDFFAGLGPFRGVVEATASYEWLVTLIEPLAQAVLLAHPGKLRVIAESHKKTDRLDAQVLAEFLARDLIPRAYRPTPGQREHRMLVRQRQSPQGRITAVKCKLRRILSDVNADRKDLFTAAGLAHLAAVPLSDSARFVADQLTAESHALRGQLKELTARLKAFAAEAPTAEARAVLRTIPGVGPVTVDMVVSELGDLDRFGSAKQVAAYAGLAPTVRQSGAGKSRELPITKRGSGLLRWALVEASWRLVRQSHRWRSIYEGIKKRRGGKKAIVAVARRLLGVMVSMLRTMSPYRLIPT